MRVAVRVDFLAFLIKKFFVFFIDVSSAKLAGIVSDRRLAPCLNVAPNEPFTVSINTKRRASHLRVSRVLSETPPSVGPNLLRRFFSVTDKRRLVVNVPGTMAAHATRCTRGKINARFVDG